MEKIAYVKVKHEDNIHRIPATEIKEEGLNLLIYHGEKKVSDFNLNTVENWALELPPD